MITINPALAKPEPVPSLISRRQCARQMRINNMITNEEMLAMTHNGTPPAVVMVIFNSIADEDIRFAALADFASDNYLRSNPLLVSIMLATPGATEAGIDDFFRLASKL